RNLKRVSISGSSICPNTSSSVLILSPLLSPCLLFFFGLSYHGGSKRHHRSRPPRALNHDLGFAVGRGRGERVDERFEGDGSGEDGLLICGEGDGGGPCLLDLPRAGFG
ncbi:hypothetical protein BHE74_00057792, partial [Ensete ventricosum]